MRKTEFRNLSGWCLLVSFLFHILVLILFWLPGTWFREGKVGEGRAVFVFLPGEAGARVGSGEGGSSSQGALSGIPPEGFPRGAPPFSLRGPRFSPRAPGLSPGGVLAGGLPARGFPQGIVLPPSPEWGGLIDTNRLMLLPPHYFSRFALIRPDTTIYPYTVNDFIHQAFLEAIRERGKEEKLLVDTPLGEFGMTPGVLHLGPVKLPVPFTSYSSTESRTAQREYQEIQSQESGISSRDEELDEQRQRVLEWQERRGKSP
jgi:hypothetical protein